MIRGTATKPEIRRRKIIEGLQRNNNMYKNNPFTTEFGICFEDSLAKIQGRLELILLVQRSELVCAVSLILKSRYPMLALEN